MSIDDTIGQAVAGGPTPSPVLGGATPPPVDNMPSEPPELLEDIAMKMTPEVVAEQLEEVAAKQGIDTSQQTPEEKSKTMVQGAKVAEVQAVVSKKVEAGQPVAEAVAETREDYLASADLHDQRAIEILDKMNEGQTLPPEDALAMLFAALIPAMLGAAVGGKAGAAAGFSGASSALLTSLKNDEKNFREGEKTKAKLELAKAADIRAQGRILEKEERANEEWDRRFSKKAAVDFSLAALKARNKPGEKISPVDMRALGTLETGLHAIGKARDYAKAQFGEGVENLGQVVTRKVKSWKPGSKEGRFHSLVMGMVNKLASSEVKGVASDKDVQRMLDWVNGGRAFASVEDFIFAMDRIEELILIEDQVFRGNLELAGVTGFEETLQEKIIRRNKSSKDVPSEDAAPSRTPTPSGAEPPGDLLNKSKLEEELFGGTKNE